jgi:hypothetical protein
MRSAAFSLEQELRGPDQVALVAGATGIIGPKKSPTFAPG